MPSNYGTAPAEKSFMYRWQSFITYAESSELMHPGDGPLDRPAGRAQIAAACNSPLDNLMHYAPLLDRKVASSTVVNTIGLDRPGLRQKPRSFATAEWNANDQRQQLRNVMPVSLGQDDINREALCVDEDMVFAGFLAVTSCMRPSFFPPCTAHTDELSATTREISSLSASRSLSSSIRCRLPRTSPCCQARSRRQEDMSGLDPITFDSHSDVVPDCRTNRKPGGTHWSLSGLRPGWVLGRHLTGNIGRTIFNISSFTSSRDISPRCSRCQRGDMSPCRQRN